MAIVRWDPFKDFLSLHDDFDRLFGIGPLSDKDAKRRWTPACDLRETEKEVIVDCELPGMEGEDVDVEVDDNILIIKGERKSSSETKEGDYKRIERRHGSFARYLTLPQTIDQEKIEATFDKGILKIRMEKLAIEKPKSVKVQIEDEKES